MADHVLVRRLVGSYLVRCPWWGRGHMKNLTLRGLRVYEPVVEHMDEWERSDPDRWHTAKIRKYDLGRIRFFVDQLRDPSVELDPIEVDNRCEARCILPEPIVNDGHHRLVAYHLIRRRTIPVEYGGLVEVLAYLKGERARLPREAVIV